MNNFITNPIPNQYHKTTVTSRTKSIIQKIKYLVCQFVLFLVSKRAHSRNNITQIILDENDSRTKFRSHSFFILIRFARIVTIIFTTFIIAVKIY